MQYIRNSVIKEIVVKYPDRSEADRFFNYPFAAIEGLKNYKEKKTHGLTVRYNDMNCF